MTLLDFEELCDYWRDSPPVHWMVAAYLGIGEKKETPRGHPTIAPNAPRPGSAEALNRHVTSEEAMQIFGVLGHAGSGMIAANIHEGFAVQEMPLSFEDLRRMNGL